MNSTFRIQERIILKKYQYISAILGVLFSLFYAYIGAWISFIAPSIFTIIVIFSIILEQKKYYLLPAILLISSLWLAPSWCILMSNGLHSPLLIWLIPTIFMAAVLLGSRWSILVGSLSLINILCTIIYAEELSTINEIHSHSNQDQLLFLSIFSAILLSAYYAYIFSHQHQHHIKQLKNQKLKISKHKDKAEKANLAKTHFISQMNHELRTPLNAILGFSQVLELDYEKVLTKKQSESVHEIYKAGKHLLTFINEILNVSKLSDGYFELSFQQVLLNDLLNNSVQTIRPLAQRKNINIRLIDNDRVIDNAIDFKAICLNIDPIYFKQIILNLLGNAIKYNKKNGEVVITCIQLVESQSVHIQISDTGIGIKKELQHNLFRPFERLGLESSGLEGSGIGLFITKKFTELMGGSIGFESTPNEGSNFWVEFPYVE